MDFHVLFHSFRQDSHVPHSDQRHRINWRHIAPKKQSAILQRPQKQVSLIFISDKSSKRKETFRPLPWQDHLSSLE
jgi:hypothetical protein